MQRVAMASHHFLVVVCNFPPFFSLSMLVCGLPRYMNYNGCKRKFDIPSFVARFEGASPSSSHFKLAQKALQAALKKR